MRCSRCDTEIPPGAEEEFHSATVCEDCLMDLLSPSRTCDPWAVRSASEFTYGQEGATLTPTQQKLLDAITSSGGATIEELAQATGIRTTDIQREIATLRHLKKIRGGIKHGRKVFLPWNGSQTTTDGPS